LFGFSTAGITHVTPPFAVMRCGLNELTDGDVQIGLGPVKFKLILPMENKEWIMCYTGRIQALQIDDIWNQR